MGTMANSEDPDEYVDNSSGSALFAKTKLIFREKIQYYFFKFQL